MSIEAEQLSHLFLPQCGTKPTIYTLYWSFQFTIRHNHTTTIMVIYNIHSYSLQLAVSLKIAAPSSSMKHSVGAMYYF